MPRTCPPTRRDACTDPSSARVVWKSSCCRSGWTNTNVRRRDQKYNCREKLLMFLCIASILIAVVTGCILAYSKTPLSSTHPCGEAVNKIQTSENNKANNRSAVVGSNEFEASNSNEISTTDIKKWESVNKTLATEMNKTDQSEIAGYDIPEASAANETDTAETDESEPLPQPVLMVTEVGSTYLEVAWVLPEESKTNAAHIHYIVHFRKYGAQWQEVSFLNASRTSYSLTNLNPGMSYQIYVMSVDSRFSRPGEIATVRTSDKFVNHSPSKGHGKQLLVYVATIIILVIAIAGVYNYSRTSFSALHPYGEEVKEVSTAELNKADTLEVSLSNEIKASGSNQTGIAKTENLVSSINLPEERDWMTDVKDFLIEGTGVDVTFELETPNGKVEFFAHQLILALRSPYFADEFYGKGKNNGHLRICLKGIDPKAFKEMLRYCYDNKPRLRTTEDACVLFKVASDFKMLNLQKLCRTFIRDAEIDP